MDTNLNNIEKNDSLEISLDEILSLAQLNGDQMDTDRLAVAARAIAW